MVGPPRYPGGGMNRNKDMGSTRLDSLASTVDDAAARPWRHGFVALLRRIAAAHDESPLPGQSRRPSQDAFRIGQQASLSFAPRELAQVERRDDRVDMRLFGLGLLGPGGVLPLHYTETVRERALTRRDMAPGDFMDLFHHRALSHFYRAWAQAQATAGLDRPQEETFTRYVAWLSGDETDDVALAPLPRHARWASAAHRVRKARNPEGLVRTLAHFFGVSVVLQEYVLRWIPLETHDHCLLGQTHAATALGGGAIAGGMVPDRQAQFRLVIGPLDLPQYMRFTPGAEGDDARGRDLRSLVEWVRAFIGFEYAWDVELRVIREKVPAACLGSRERLGWSSWLGDNNTRSGEWLTGMVFEPEAYIECSKRSQA